jgi:adenosylhomocysteine nucleosidase
MNKPYQRLYQRQILFILIIILLIILMTVVTQSVKQQKDNTPRIAVVAETDLANLIMNKAFLSKSSYVNKKQFNLGSIERNHVIVFSVGDSMLDAAMYLQTAIEHYNIKMVIFISDSRSINPKIRIGDVIIPTAWGQYQDKMSWYVIDEKRTEFLQQFNALELANCDQKSNCVEYKPLIIIGGVAITTPVNAANQTFRNFLRDNYKTQIIDNQGAAIAHVAMANEIPFINISGVAGGAGEAERKNINQELAQANAIYTMLKILREYKVSGF